MNKIILVDKNDKIVGSATREDGHNNSGIAHRAITVFLNDANGNILITRRSDKKTLWPGYWDTSCSTHPYYPNESYVKSAERRIGEELGVKSKLEIIDKFQYKAKYKNIGSENEICALLVGQCDQTIKPNRDEVSEYLWISPEKLLNNINKKKDKYSPWLIIALKKYLGKLCNEKI